MEDVHLQKLYPLCKKPAGDWLLETRSCISFFAPSTSVYPSLLLAQLCILLFRRAYIPVVLFNCLIFFQLVLPVILGFVSLAKLHILFFPIAVCEGSVCASPVLREASKQKSFLSAFSTIVLIFCLCSLLWV